MWDYKNKLSLNEKQLEDWAILDTLDGIYAKYDNPVKKKKLLKFLNKNNIKLLKNNEIENIYMTKL